MNAFINAFNPTTSNHFPLGVIKDQHLELKEPPGCMQVKEL